MLMLSSDGELEMEIRRFSLEYAVVIDGGVVARITKTLRNYMIDWRWLPWTCTCYSIMTWTEQIVLFIHG